MGPVDSSVDNTTFGWILGHGVGGLLGALLTGLSLGRTASPAWRLDGPPRVEASTIRRRAILAGLGAPRRADRFGSATDALAALESALLPADAVASSWPMFRGDPGRTGSRPIDQP